MTSRVRVDRTIMRDLARNVERSVTRDARPVIAHLAQAIGSASGPSAYRKVYGKLATGVRLRPAPDQPPSIEISGGGGFSGGGTISSLIWPYEYGAGAGDTSRSARHSRGRRRRGSQFPPRRASGWWVGPVLEARQDQLDDGFGKLIDEAINDTARQGGL